MSKSRLGLLALLAAVIAVTVAVGSGALSGARDLPRADGPIMDPIPAKPMVSGLALTLQEFVTMPRSVPPPNRALPGPGDVQARWCGVVGDRGVGMPWVHQR